MTSGSGRLQSVYEQSYVGRWAGVGWGLGAMINASRARQSVGWWVGLADETPTKERRS